MNNKPRTRIFKTVQEVVDTRLDPAHYRQLLGWVYGSSAENELLWDDSYIREIDIALSTLSHRQSITLRALLLGARHQQIGYLLSFTSERIRQFESKALRRLRLRSGLKVILKIHLRLCEYPTTQKRGPHLSTPKVCLHCSQPQQSDVLFPACPVRTAQFKQETSDSSLSGSER